MEKVHIVRLQELDSFKRTKLKNFIRMKKEYYALQKIMFFFIIHSIAKSKNNVTFEQQELKRKFLSLLQGETFDNRSKKMDFTKTNIEFINTLKQIIKSNQVKQISFLKMPEFLQFLMNTTYKQQHFPVKNKQINLIQYFSQFLNKQVKQKVQFPRQSQQIIITASKSKHQKTDQSQVQQSQTHQILYKLITIKICNQHKIIVKETNQEKFIYFKIIKQQNGAKIAQLFQKNQRQEVFQSQNQQSSCDSEIVLDQDYFKLSEKLSNSGRKNSFNSGQFQEENQNLLLSKTNIYESTHAQMSQIKLCSHNTRSDNFIPEKDHQTLKNMNSMYTSIDLIMKQNVQKKQNISNQKAIKQTRQQFQVNNQLSERQRPTMSINLVNQQKKVVYTTNLFADFIFKNMQKNQTKVIQKRKNLIRKFFKKGSHELSLQRQQSQKHRKYSQDIQLCEQLFRSMRQQTKSLQKMAKQIKVQNQSYFD